MKPSAKTMSITSIILQVAKSFEPASVIKGSFSNIKEILAGTRTYYGFVIGFWVLIYISTILALNAIRVGYHEAYAATREMPWGILISTYVYLVVTSTGLCVISAMGHIFGIKSFAPLARRAAYLSIITVLSGFIAILMEIENPFKMMLYNVLSPNLASNIWWMGTLYGAFMFFMIIEYTSLLVGIHKIAVYAGFVALLSEILANSNLGAVFGMLHGREFWYGPYMPIFFITSAVMSGCAAIIFFTWLAYKVNHKKMEPDMLNAMKVMSKFTAFMIAVITFFTTWKMIIGSAGGYGSKEAIISFVTGPYALNFWVFDIALSLVLPFILLIMSKGEKMGMMVTASVMMLVGIFFMRFDMLVFGQTVAVYQSMGVNEYKDLLLYTPSFHEIAIVLGTLGTVALAFLLGEKVLKGHEETEPHH
jgi:molybdopterin-containing oxidoreductase family membrane subunit